MRGRTSEQTTLGIASERIESFDRETDAHAVQPSTNEGTRQAVRGAPDDQSTHTPMRSGGELTWSAIAPRRSRIPAPMRSPWSCDGMHLVLSPDKNKERGEGRSRSGEDSIDYVERGCDGRSGRGGGCAGISGGCDRHSCTFHREYCMTGGIPILRYRHRCLPQPSGGLRVRASANSTRPSAAHRRTVRISACVRVLRR